LPSQATSLEIEVLSFEEQAELITLYGRTLEIPEHLEDSTSLPASIRAVRAQENAVLLKLRFETKVGLRSTGK